MTKVQISTLISRYLWNELTPDERRQLFDWVNASEENKCIFKRCTDIDLVMLKIDKLFSSNEEASVLPIEQTKIFRLWKHLNRFKNRKFKLA